MALLPDLLIPLYDHLEARDKKWALIGFYVPLDDGGTHHKFTYLCLFAYERLAYKISEEKDC